MFGCLSSQSSVPNRLRDKDNVGLVSLEAVSHREKTAGTTIRARVPLCLLAWQAIPSVPPRKNAGKRN
jgi:hypothetical protein